MRQMPLALGLAAQPSFENFVAAGNELALHALRERVAAAGVAVVPPIYIHGPAGSGKTHLLAALGRAIGEAGECFGAFDAQAALPWVFDERWRCVLIDDADRLDALRQHAAFTLYVQAAASGAAVAAAGRLPPVDAPVRDDLRSRLAWGPVFALQPLPETQVRAILRREADQRGVLLNDEVMHFVLTRLSRDLGFLMRLLQQLDQYALAEGRSITVPLVKQMLAEEGLAA